MGVFKDIGMLGDFVWAIQRDDVVSNFYRMLNSYDRTSSNIAFFGRRKDYEKLLKSFRKNIHKNTDDKEIKVNENKHIFIINELERTIVYIENINELDNCCLKFGRYM